MNIDDIFSSKYIKASDLRGRDVTVTIVAVDVQKMNDGKTKPCIFFANKEKGLLLNKTNSYELADTFGTETNNWIGKQITLYPARVDFQGKMVPGVRVRVQHPTQFQRAQQFQAPAAQRPVATQDDPRTFGQHPNAPGSRVEFDDEVPFSAEFR
jgi:hypothetical protein